MFVSNPSHDKGVAPRRITIRAEELHFDLGVEYIDMNTAQTYRTDMFNFSFTQVNTTLEIIHEITNQTILDLQDNDTLGLLFNYKADTGLLSCTATSQLGKNVDFRFICSSIESYNCLGHLFN